MKIKVLVIILMSLVLFSEPVHAAEATLPISARIVNLAKMPVDQAIAFCDARNMSCPAIREKAERISGKNKAEG